MRPQIPRPVPIHPRRGQPICPIPIPHPASGFQIRRKATIKQRRPHRQFPRRIALRQHHRQRQIRPRAIPRHHDAPTNPARRPLRAQPPPPRQTILQRRRKHMLRRQPVIDPKYRQPAFRRQHTQHPVMRIHIARKPAATMHIINHPPPRRPCRLIQPDPQRPARPFD